MKRLGAWLLPSVALATGVLGVDAVWVVASVASNRPCSWMALIAALDVAFMLRLANVRAGSGRIVLAVLATALAVLLAQWLIAATQMGLALGLEPLDSAMKKKGTLVVREADQVFDQVLQRVMGRLQNDVA